MNDYQEIPRITEYFQKNKLTMIKMSHSIDPSDATNLTQYNGYMQLSEDGLTLEIYTKKPIPHIKESTVNQDFAVQQVDDAEEERQRRLSEAERKNSEKLNRMSLSKMKK